MTFEEILKQYNQEHLDAVCEPPAYLLEKQQGEYTIEDFFNTPEGMCMELIDGEFVYLYAANLAHQRLLLKLASMLDRFIEEHGGSCVTHIESNVQLKDTEATVLIPDIAVVCDSDKEKGNRIVGAPDLVIEILSPSTKAKDTGIKKKKYKEAGVREYWIIDLAARCITVFEFASNKTSLYGFDEKIPVGIFGGRCVIDVKALMEKLKY